MSNRRQYRTPNPWNVNKECLDLLKWAQELLEASRVPDSYVVELEEWNYRASAVVNAGEKYL